MASKNDSVLLCEHVRWKFLLSRLKCSTVIFGMRLIHLTYTMLSHNWIGWKANLVLLFKDSSVIT